MLNPQGLMVAIGAAVAAPSLLKLVGTRRVSFKATKKVSEPAKVSFKTKSGKKVAFNGHKVVKKKVPVSFRAKRK